MSEEMSGNMSEKNVRKNVRRYVRKGCPKKCHKERLYWTVSIELQAPRRLKTDVATAILALAKQFYIFQILVSRRLGVSSEIVLNQA